jgi:hypothetical protein
MGYASRFHHWRFIMKKRALDSRNGQRFAGMQALIMAGLMLRLDRRR